MQKEKRSVNSNRGTSDKAPRNKRTMIIQKLKLKLPKKKDQKLKRKSNKVDQTGQTIVFTDTNRFLLHIYLIIIFI